jgi:uncharacterized membrane-anchored protein YjiN (DUF445 family)
LPERNKHLADRALLICSLIFIGATAIHTWVAPGSLWLFLQLTAAAGLIGGIADWYGVVSVYGRPLRIPWRTEIIIRQRPQLTQAICGFVSDDILSVDNIRVRLASFHVTKRLLRLFKNPGEDAPAQWLADFAANMLWDIYQEADLNEIGGIVNKLGSGLAQSINPAEDFIRGARWTLENGYLERFMQTVAPDCAAFSQNPGLRQVVAEFIATLAQNYAGDNMLRRMFMPLLQAKIAAGMDAYIQNLFRQMAEDPEHPTIATLRRRLELELASFAADPVQQAAFNQKILDWLSANGLGDAISAELHRLRQTQLITQGGLRQGALSLLRLSIDRIEGDQVLYGRIDAWLIEKISQLAEQFHCKIGNLVAESLDKYSDVQLVNLLRDSTEGDLQIIRLNGMLCGILIGAIVALLRIFVIGGGIG